MALRPNMTKQCPSNYVRNKALLYFLYDTNRNLEHSGQRGNTSTHAHGGTVAKIRSARSIPHPIINYSKISSDSHRSAGADVTADKNTSRKTNVINRVSVTGWWTNSRLRYRQICCTSSYSNVIALSHSISRILEFVYTDEDKRRGSHHTPETATRLS
jgi:hypothetical protein